MPFPALLLIAAALLPLGGLVVLLSVGRRMGAPLAGYAGAFFVALSFLCGGWAMMRWLGTGNFHGAVWGKGVAPISLSWNWLAPTASPGAGRPLALDLGIYVDSLTVGMVVTVTLLAMLVHIFAARSMRRDPRFVRFFSILSLMTFAMLGLLISGTLIQMLLFLELLSFCAAMLVGFRSDRDEALRAASKLFVFHRIGDAALVGGIAILVAYLGDLGFIDLWLACGNAGAGAAVMLPRGGAFPPALLTTAGALLFLGAASRCAQFPLHVWAADTSAAVAPACTMIFCAAPAASGVYVVARLFPLLTPSARLFVAITGATTLFAAALVACAQTDLKKVLVAAAVSQLGLMMLGLGSASWVGALFFLIAYAFYQSLLFLCAGGVIRAARGATDLTRFGGLITRVPLTAILFGIGALAACGVGRGDVGLSGYESRSVLLGDVAGFAALARSAGRSGAYWMLFAAPLAATLLLAFALTRCWMLTFWGEPRDRRLHEHAREVPTLLWPLLVLAVMTALAGRWLGAREVIESAVLESRQAVRLAADADPNYRGGPVHAFDSLWPAEDTLDDAAADTIRTPIVSARLRGRDLVNRWVWPAYAIGIALAAAIYLRGLRTADLLLRLLPPLRWLRAWLAAQMYFDDLYDALIVALTVGLAGLLAWFDRRAVQGGRPLARKFPDA